MDILEKYFEKLDEAYEKEDVEFLQEINKEILTALKESTEEDEPKNLDYDREFINNIRGKSVYKSLEKALKGEDLSNEALVKLLSSLITHIAIECEIQARDIKDYPVNRIIDYIREIINYGGYNKDDIIQFLRDRYREFIA